ncbi:uncharacterized protein LOC102678802 [Apis dorsata]|uniref:uncharacterized protein LOC102678802 n=1 Tax=Apis dorsata TaxID=7462 RepID=UPI0003DF4F13|nr:uncharacterized protein LOC102678802 [Apis dorsata]
MYPRYDFLFVFVYHVVTGLSLPATYDQRQTGDLNVQVHLKDVQVLALLDSEMLDDYTEYDYFYDYADFTIKPMIKPNVTTTTEPSTSEIIEQLNFSNITSQNLTFPINESNTNSNIENTEILSLMDVEKANETLSISSNKMNSTTNENNILKMKVNDKIENLFEDIEKNRREQNNWRLSHNMGDSSKILSRKRCRSGYSPDGNGRCRRLSKRRLSLIPLALRLVPKFLDDTARNTRNFVQKEDNRMHSNQTMS